MANASLLWAAARKSDKSRWERFRKPTGTTSAVNIFPWTQFRWWERQPSPPPYEHAGDLRGASAGTCGIDHGREIELAVREVRAEGITRNQLEYGGECARRMRSGGYGSRAGRRNGGDGRSRHRQIHDRQITSPGFLGFRTATSPERRIRAGSSPCGAYKRTK